MEQNIKIDYDKIAIEQGIEESRRIWRENNADRIKNRKEWNENPIICPCCEQYSFKIQDNYEICPICNWEDDVRQRKEPNRVGGANKLSLNQFKLEWFDKQLLQDIVQAEKVCDNKTPIEIISVLKKMKQRFS